MRPRLLKALQHGGCAALGNTGRWKIYRQTDLRGRMIGEVDGAEIDPLRAEGRLKQFGLAQPERLVWSGPVPDSVDAPAPAAPLELPLGKSAVGPQSLLTRVLASYADPEKRRRLVRAALSFREDIKASEQAMPTGGMNWQSISAGTRLEGGRPAQGFSALVIDARRRLASVLEHFPDPEVQRLLILTVAQDASRRQVALRTGLSPRRVDTEAARQLSRLADAYDISSARPDQV